MVAWSDLVLDVSLAATCVNKSPIKNSIQHPHGPHGRKTTTDLVSNRAYDASRWRHLVVDRSTYAQPLNARDDDVIRNSTITMIKYPYTFFLVHIHVSSNQTAVHVLLLNMKVLHGYLRYMYKVWFTWNWHRCVLVALQTFCYHVPTVWLYSGVYNQQETRWVNL